MHHGLSKFKVSTAWGIIFSQRLRGGVRVDCAQSGYHVIFEGLYCSFYSIATMDSGGGELEFDVLCVHVVFE